MKPARNYGGRYTRFSTSRRSLERHLLTQACRVADIIAELDDAADEAPLTVRGSQGQPVISPFIAEARVQRALQAQLLGRLGLPDNDEDADEAARRSKAGKTVAKARWPRGY